MGGGPSKPKKDSPPAAGAPKKKTAKSKVAPTSDAEMAVKLAMTESFTPFKPETGDYHRVAGGICQIGMVEIKGRREEQQDAMVVGVPKAPGVISNPPEFLLDKIGLVVADHAECEKGTTLCTVIAQRTDDEDVRLTCGNLGDSRIAMVLEYADGEYVSIVLTEDHSLEKKEFRDFVLEKGGEVIEDKGEIRVSINGRSLNMMASVGDSAYGEVLSHEADIFDYSVTEISQNLRPGKALKSAHVVASCDGLWDALVRQRGKEAIRTSLGVDYFINVSADAKGTRMEHVAATGPVLEIEGHRFHLSDLARDFYAGSAAGAVVHDSLAEFLVDYAAKISSDNISVATFPVMLDSKPHISVGAPIMAIICDGHGEGLIGDWASKEKWDGSMVAYSAMSQLAEAMDLRKIAGLDPEIPVPEELRIAAKPKPVKRAWEKESEVAAPGTAPATAGAGGVAGGAVHGGTGGKHR